MNPAATTIATAIIFALTYGGISLGRIPGLRLDRAGIALAGAALMMAVGAITPEEAYRAVNLDTLALLLGMMIIVAQNERSHHQTDCVVNEECREGGGGDRDRGEQNQRRMGVGKRPARHQAEKAGEPQMRHDNHHAEQES
jgi:hypothetical protein